MSVKVCLDGEIIELSDEQWAQMSPPAEANALMPDISDRQFAAGLWSEKIITFEEFLAFIGPGKIPAAVQTIVDQLPDDATGDPTPRKEAVGFLAGSKAYQFSHPLVETVRQFIEATDPKWTPDYLRSRWELWATL